MNYYKKAETQLKHDEARKQFVGELNVLRLQFNETHDYSILCKIIKYEDMLALYDKEMGYLECLRLS